MKKTDEYSNIKFLYKYYTIKILMHSDSKFLIYVISDAASVKNEIYKLYDSKSKKARNIDTTLDMIYDDANKALKGSNLEEREKMYNSINGINKYNL